MRFPFSRAKHWGQTLVVQLRASRFLDPNWPFRPERWPFFYGWMILAVSMVGMMMSIPGQTAGVSIFTDHLLAATGLSRLALSNAYLVGTLTSGLLLPWGGVFLDRVGARLTGMLASGGLALTLCYLSNCDRIATALAPLLSVSPATMALIVLVMGFICLRFFGQGMLTLVNRTTLGRWFDRQRGLAAGLLGIFIAFTFGGAPLYLSQWVRLLGWRGAWLSMALLVGIGMGLISWLMLRDRPEDCGLQMDGGPVDRSSAILKPGPGQALMARLQTLGQPPPPTRRDFTRREAISTLAFWATTLAISTLALTITGITFHVVDIGTSMGLSEAESVSWFLPVAIASTGVGLSMGILSDRLPLKGLYLVMMVAEVSMLFGVAHLGDLLWRWVAIVGLGVTVGCSETLGSVTLPRFFGRVHLGAIAGVQMMSLVIASALGPTLLALFKNWLGSYRIGLYACAMMPAVMFGVLLLVQNPQRRVSQ